MVDPRLAQARDTEPSVQTTHVREMAANLLLGRALQMLEAASGMVVFWDAEGRWNRDSFALPGQPDRLEELAPVLEALLEWTLYTEKPVVIHDLRQSRWSRHLLHGADPLTAGMDVLGQLAQVATEPLSSLGSARPEGVG